MEETESAPISANNSYVPSSAETVLTNTDLLTQILLRIPASSLVQFKFLSKQWHSIISDPEFCLSHTQFYLQNPKPTCLIIRNQSGFFKIPLDDQAILPSLQNIESNIPFSAPGVRILQSCNGLFLCRAIWKPHSIDDDDDSYVIRQGFIIIFFLYNPTTMQFKKIKFPKEIKYSVLIVALAFDPSLSPHYNLISVRKMLETNDFSYKFYVYSSQVDSWSFAGDHHGAHLGFFDPIYCKGAVHWICGFRHLLFEVDNRVLKHNGSVITREISESFIYCGESGGRLYGVKSNRTGRRPGFDVCESALGFSGWDVKYHFNTKSIKLAYPELDKSFSLFKDEFWILSIVPGCDNQEGLMMVLVVDGVALAYDLHHNIARKICDVPLTVKMSFCRNRRFVFPYFESLFRL